MSLEEKYITAPLSALRKGDCVASALDLILKLGIVNAAKGTRKVFEDEVFEKILERGRERAEENGFLPEPPENLRLVRDGKPIPKEEAIGLWNDVLVGREILQVTGGNVKGAAQDWLDHYREGEVFFRVRADLMWGAITTARREAGLNVAFRPGISWREFRILAAILSTPTSGAGFCFLGWESIQARACGYHSKALFQAQKHSLPKHCDVLTRSKIRTTCEKLEALGFFARVRYAAGESGGYMAYSFRHTREELQSKVKHWRDEKRKLKAKVASNRTADKAAFGRSKSTNPKPHKK